MGFFLSPHFHLLYIVPVLPAPSPRPLHPCVPVYLCRGRKRTGPHAGDEQDVAPPGPQRVHALRGRRQVPLYGTHRHQRGGTVPHRKRPQYVQLLSSRTNESDERVDLCSIFRLYLPVCIVLLRLPSFITSIPFSLFPFPHPFLAECLGVEQLVMNLHQTRVHTLYLDDNGVQLTVRTE